MKLYLVRHGEAVSSAAEPDPPLSKLGRSQTEAVASLLMQAQLAINMIIHSTKMRAKQTAEILAATLALQCPLVQKDGLKPMDPVMPILDEINMSDTNLMLVGHLPFLEKLLTTLVQGQEGPCPINFCGSCIACLEGPPWIISWVVSPTILRNTHFVQKHV